MPRRWRRRSSRGEVRLAPADGQRTSAQDQAFVRGLNYLRRRWLRRRGEREAENKIEEPEERLRRPRLVRIWVWMKGKAKAAREHELLSCFPRRRWRTRVQTFKPGEEPGPEYGYLSEDDRPGPSLSPRQRKMLEMRVVTPLEDMDLDCDLDVIFLEDDIHPMRVPVKERVQRTIQRPGSSPRVDTDGGSSSTAGVPDMQENRLIEQLVSCLSVYTDGGNTSKDDVVSDKQENEGETESRPGTTLPPATVEPPPEEIQARIGNPMTTRQIFRRRMDGWGASRRVEYPGMFFTFEAPTRPPSPPRLSQAEQQQLVQRMASRYVYGIVDRAADISITREVRREHEARQNSPSRFRVRQRLDKRTRHLETVRRYQEEIMLKQGPATHQPQAPCQRVVEQPENPETCYREDVWHGQQQDAGDCQQMEPCLDAERPPEENVEHTPETITCQEDTSLLQGVEKPCKDAEGPVLEEMECTQESIKSPEDSRPLQDMKEPCKDEEMPVLAEVECTQSSTTSQEDSRPLQGMEKPLENAEGPVLEEMQRIQESITSEEDARPLQDMEQPCKDAERPVLEEVERTQDSSSLVDNCPLQDMEQPCKDAERPVLEEVERTQDSSSLVDNCPLQDMEKTCKDEERPVLEEVERTLESSSVEDSCPLQGIKTPCKDAERPVLEEMECAQEIIKSQEDSRPLQGVEKPCKDEERPVLEEVESTQNSTTSQKDSRPLHDMEQPCKDPERSVLEELQRNLGSITTQEDSRPLQDMEKPCEDEERPVLAEVEMTQESSSLEDSRPLPGLENPCKDAERPVEENVERILESTSSPEDSCPLQDTEKPRQDADGPVLEEVERTQESASQDDSRPLQGIETPCKDEERPILEEVERTQESASQEDSRPLQDMEQPCKNAERPVEENVECIQDGSSLVDNRPLQDTEQPCKDAERPVLEEVERTQESASPEDSRPLQGIETPSKDAERPVLEEVERNQESSSLEDSRPLQDLENPCKDAERPDEANVERILESTTSPEDSRPLQGMETPCKDAERPVLEEVERNQESSSLEDPRPLKDLENPCKDAERPVEENVERILESTTSPGDSRPLQGIETSCKDAERPVLEEVERTHQSATSQEDNRPLQGMEKTCHDAERPAEETVEPTPESTTSQDSCPLQHMAKTSHDAEGPAEETVEPTLKSTTSQEDSGPLQDMAKTCQDAERPVEENAERTLEPTTSKEENDQDPLSDDDEDDCLMDSDEEAEPTPEELAYLERQRRMDEQLRIFRESGEQERLAELLVRANLPIGVIPQYLRDAAKIPRPNLQSVESEVTEDTDLPPGNLPDPPKEVLVEEGAVASDVLKPLRESLPPEDCFPGAKRPDTPIDFPPRTVLDRFGPPSEQDQQRPVILLPPLKTPVEIDYSFWPGEDERQQILMGNHFRPRIIRCNILCAPSRQHNQSFHFYAHTMSFGGCECGLCRHRFSTGEDATIYSNGVDIRTMVMNGICHSLQHMREKSHIFRVRELSPPRIRIITCGLDGPNAGLWTPPIGLETSAAIGYQRIYSEPDSIQWKTGIPDQEAAVAAFRRTHKGEQICENQRTSPISMHARVEAANAKWGTCNASAEDKKSNATLYPAAKMERPKTSRRRPAKSVAVCSQAKKPIRPRKKQGSTLPPIDAKPTLVSAKKNWKLVTGRVQCWRDGMRKTPSVSSGPAAVTKAGKGAKKVTTRKNPAPSTGPVKKNGGKTDSGSTRTGPAVRAGKAIKNATGSIGKAVKKAGKGGKNTVSKVPATSAGRVAKKSATTKASKPTTAKSNGPQGKVAKSQPAKPMTSRPSTGKRTSAINKSSTAKPKKQKVFQQVKPRHPFLSEVAKSTTGRSSTGKHTSAINKSSTAKPKKQKAFKQVRPRHPFLSQVPIQVFHLGKPRRPAINRAPKPAARHGTRKALRPKPKTSRPKSSNAKSPTTKSAKGGSPACSDDGEAGGNSSDKAARRVTFAIPKLESNRLVIHGDDDEYSEDEGGDDLRGSPSQ